MNVKTVVTLTAIAFLFTSVAFATPVIRSDLDIFPDELKLAIVDHLDLLSLSALVTADRDYLYLWNDVLRFKPKVILQVAQIPASLLSFTTSDALLATFRFILPQLSITESNEFLLDLVKNERVHPALIEFICTEPMLTNPVFKLPPVAVAQLWIEASDRENSVMLNALHYISHEQLTTLHLNFYFDIFRDHEDETQSLESFHKFLNSTQNGLDEDERQKLELLNRVRLSSTELAGNIFQSQFQYLREKASLHPNPTWNYLTAAMNEWLKDIFGALRTLDFYSHINALTMAFDPLSFIAYTKPDSVMESLLMQMAPKKFLLFKEACHIQRENLILKLRSKVDQFNIEEGFQCAVRDGLPKTVALLAPLLCWEWLYKSLTEMREVKLTFDVAETLLKDCRIAQRVNLILLAMLEQEYTMTLDVFLLFLNHPKFNRTLSDILKIRGKLEKSSSYATLLLNLNSKDISQI